MVSIPISVSFVDYIYVFFFSFFETEKKLSYKISLIVGRLDGNFVKQKNLDN